MCADAKHTSRMPDFCVALLCFLHSYTVAALYICAIYIYSIYIYMLQMSRSIVLTAMVWSEPGNNADGSIALNWYSGFPLTYTCRRATSTNCHRHTTQLPASLRLISVLHTHVQTWLSIDLDEISPPIAKHCNMKAASSERVWTP
jgi:hypothetical protein